MSWTSFRTSLLLLISVLLFEVQGIQAKPLVNAEWLKRNIEHPDLVVLDVRSPNSRGNPFLKGHIPGARSAPYNQGWRTRRDGIIGMLPEREKIVEHIKSLGVNTSSLVVIVPKGESSTDFGAATRIYWTFKMLGHSGVSILDGGYKAWRLSGGALSEEVNPVENGNFNGRYQASLLALQTKVHQSLGGDAHLIDARPISQYEGRSKSRVVSRAGTIPGAFSIPYSKLYDASSARFASRSEIARISSKLGFSGSKTPIITFCNTGHWASLAWFAFHEIRGDASVSLYDGSMTEWTRYHDNPVQKIAK